LIAKPSQFIFAPKGTTKVVNLVKFSQAVYEISYTQTLRTYAPTHIYTDKWITPKQYLQYLMVAEVQKIKQPATDKC